MGNILRDKKWVLIVKFCLENYNLQEHTENLKVITRSTSFECVWICLIKTN
jgi:hypothetical protein